MRKTIIVTILAFVLGFAATAQTDTVTLQNRWHHSLKIGVGIGASAPVPIPNRISEMGWTPHLGGILGYSLHYDLSQKMGLKTGLQLRHVGMSAQAKVYQMFTNATVDDAEVAGYFTGYNDTKFNATYLAVPLLFAYHISTSWTIDAGLFAAYALQGHFGGAVKDGYIRINEPTGDRVEVGCETFDFSDYVNPFNFGLELTAEHIITNRWSAWFDLSWAFNSCMKNSFSGLEYKMYNIYGFAGIDYKL